MITFVSKVLGGTTEEDYVQSKLTKVTRRYGKSRTKPSDNDFKQWAKDIVTKRKEAIKSKNISDVVPIATKDDIQKLKLTADQSAKIEARKRCALKTLLRESPLLDGEKLDNIDGDFFTYLTKNFDKLPANTAVLRRKTDKAEIYYFFEDFQVVSGELKHIQPAPAPEKRSVAKRDATIATTKRDVEIESFVTKMAKELATALLGKIGDEITNRIFPPSAPEYFDDVYNNIGNIVDQKLLEADITKINGAINGVAAWARDTYLPGKTANPPTDSWGDLSWQVIKLYDAIETLMLNDYAKPGFEVFMVAASLQLWLIQEQALVDPFQKDPFKSTFANETLPRRAKIYYDHGMKTYYQIIQARKDSVIINSESVLGTNPYGGEACWSYDTAYFWEDTITDVKGNYHISSYSGKDYVFDGEDNAIADREQRLPGVINELIQTLGDPEKTIFPVWKQLEKDPFPKTAPPPLPTRTIRWECTAYPNWQWPTPSNLPGDNDQHRGGIIELPLNVDRWYDLAQLNTPRGEKGYAYFHYHQVEGIDKIQAVTRALTKKDDLIWIYYGTEDPVQSRTEFKQGGGGIYLTVEFVP